MSLAAPLPEGLFFDLVSAEEVEAVHLLEIQGKPPLILIYALYVTVRSVGFSPDEAATLEQLRYDYDATYIHNTWCTLLQTFSFRQKTAPDLFLGAFVPQTGSNRTLLGYVDGVLTAETTLTSESMSTHVPGARTVLIHGVCVTPDARKRGIASALLAEYQQRLTAAGSYERVLLISHEETIAFYERIGFKSRGLSSIAFAGVPWFELEWAVPAGQLDGSQGAPQAIPSGLLEALQGQNVSRRRQGQLLSSFPDGIFDVSEKDDQRSNRYDLLCINERCGSIILRQGVAVLQERESVQVSVISK
jgi:guanine nucleotide exchange factor